MAKKRASNDKSVKNASKSKRGAIKKKPTKKRTTTKKKSKSRRVTNENDDRSNFNESADEDSDFNDRPFAEQQTRKSTELERFTSKYSTVKKSIQIDNHEDGICYFDRIRPAYLLKSLLNTHKLNEILKMYILITKDNRTCPYLLTKTGLLLFRKFIELRPEYKDDLCRDAADFVKFVKSSEATPNAELFLDFMILCFENDNEKLIEDFGDLRNHVSRQNHLYIKHMYLCFNMFLAFRNFKEFFTDFKQDRFDYERYERDEFRSKDFTRICIQIHNLTMGIDSDENYPLDYIFLCLIDLLVLFNKFKKAKKYLLKYNQCYPDNLNAVIYLLRFNELYLRDVNLFRQSYNKLIKLDPSNAVLLNYIDYITVPLECLKILLSFVDYAQNKDNTRVWRLIYHKLAQIQFSCSDKRNIKKFYNQLYASYWPSYQFKTISVKINPENCDFIFHKAYIFNYFQPDRSAKFVAQITAILTLAKSSKIQILRRLISTG